MDMQEVRKVIEAPRPYDSRFDPATLELQRNARHLCWEFNQTDPTDAEAQGGILRELLGSWDPHVHVMPSFRCDYGFNIHFHGGGLVNYDCVMLDTSPIELGEGVLLGPGVCLACAGHAVDATQRAEGVSTSAPITIGDGVWIGAHATVCAGVTVGAGSVIGAGAVVTHDIPAGVVAMGVPCRPVREVGEQDRIPADGLAF